jgi:signal transduction histidine kinase
MNMELKQQMLGLDPGAHLCLFYDKDPAEQMPALAPFLEQGLAQNEKCVYVADDITIHQLTNELESSGIQVEKECTRQTLQLWTRSEWRQAGALNLKRKSAQVRNIIQAARDGGFNGIRFGIEMTWTLGPDITATRLQRWEALLNELVAGEFPIRMVCQYSRARLDPRALQVALRTHPHVVFGERVYPSLFYEAPLISNRISETDKVNWMLTQIEKARAAEKTRELLARQQAALEESVRAEQALQALLRISKNLNSTLDLEPLLDQLVKNAIELVNAESGCAGLRTPQGMVCHKYFQKSEILPLEYCWAPGHGLPGWLLEHKVPYITNDALQDPQIVHALCEQFGVWSALSTPILNNQGEVLGFFEIHNKKDGSPFTQIDQDKLVAIAQSAAISIQNALAYQELQRAEKALRQQTEIVGTINRVGQVLNSQLDLEKIVQNVTDAATEITNAQFGAFFYNVVDEQGESYTLYTLSGRPRHDFDKFPLPRNTHIFAPTFKGTGVVRLEDVKQDPRYGKNPPYHGMPEGHLPVTSYLAVPVKLRSGEVLGGLFFGHSEPGVFTEHHEQIIVGLAAQAAVAMDNARLYQQAQQAIRQRDQFLSEASHELKTPLTSLLGYAQLLQRHSEETGTFSDRDQRAIAILTQQAERLNQLMSTLFDASRIEKSELKLMYAPVDLNALTCRIADDMQLLLTRHTLEFSGTPDPLLIQGDALRLEQALQNLIQNAAKYSPMGGSVKIQVERQNGHACVSVTDHGIGIPETNLPNLFRRFYRAENADAQNISGMGIGLYVVKDIVTRHKGVVQVASSEGKGSTFTIRLPLESSSDKSN